MPQNDPKTPLFDPKIPLKMGILDKNINKKQYNRLKKYQKIDFFYHFPIKKIAFKSDFKRGF
jgi:hypothetical protein